MELPVIIDTHYRILRFELFKVDVVFNKSFQDKFDFIKPSLLRSMVAFPIGVHPFFRIIISQISQKSKYVFFVDHTFVG